MKPLNFSVNVTWKSSGQSNGAHVQISNECYFVILEEYRCNRDNEESQGWGIKQGCDYLPSLGCFASLQHDSDLSDQLSNKLF